MPNFNALDQDGSKWVLKKQLKSTDYLVIYFYPAAFTGGCTKQACSYRDQKGDLASAGAQVVGVSGDKPGTLGLFALEHQLNFTLLSDESGEIATLFDVPQNEGGTITRGQRAGAGSDPWDHNPTVDLYSRPKGESDLQRYRGRRCS